MNKYLTEYIIPAVFAGIGIGIILLVGELVLSNIVYDRGFIDGFCADKDGSYNISVENLTFYDLTFYESDFINCSDGVINPYMSQFTG